MLGLKLIYFSIRGPWRLGFIYCSEESCVCVYIYIHIYIHMYPENNTREASKQIYDPLLWNCPNMNVTGLNDNQSTLVQVMAWCRQATSHYLSQCWPRSLSPYGVTRPQWVKLTRNTPNPPSRASCGVSIVRFLEEIGWVISALYCN